MSSKKTLYCTCMTITGLTYIASSHVGEDWELGSYGTTHRPYHFAGALVSNWTAGSCMDMKLCIVYEVEMIIYISIALEICSLSAMAVIKE